MKTVQPHIDTTQKRPHLMQVQEILALAYEAIDEVNRQLPPDNRIEKSPTTPLLGDGSTLDSLSLISFLVAFEEALEEAHGIRHDLLDDRFLGDPSGPLMSIESLAVFIANSEA